MSITQVEKDDLLARITSWPAGGVWQNNTTPTGKKISI